MHGKYRRRRLRAGRDLIQKRQTTTPISSGDGVASDTSTADSGDFSGPLTFTIIETIPVATSASSTQMSTLTSLSTMSSVIGTTTQTTTVSVPTSTSSTVTSTSSTVTSPTSTTSNSSTSTLIPVPSVLPPSVTPSKDDKGNSSEAQGNLSTPSTSLSGGSIAGIILACLILVAAILVFFLRKRFIQRRKRAAGAWTRRSGIVNPSSLGFGTANASTMEPLSSFGQDESKHSPISNVAPPPMAVNSPITNSPIASFNQYSSSGGGAPSMTQSPLNMSPFLATVVCTFIITLPDELSVDIGEKMRVLAEYDDGWALCMRTNGEQGMVPLECLDQRKTSTNSTLGLPIDGRGSRRISSLDSTGSKVKVTRS